VVRKGLYGPGRNCSLPKSLYYLARADIDCRRMSWIVYVRVGTGLWVDIHESASDRRNRTPSQMDRRRLRLRDPRLRLLPNLLQERRLPSLIPWIGVRDVPGS